MAKHHLFLHIGPEVVDVDTEVRALLATAGIHTPDLSADLLTRADLEIRRAHKAAGLKRKQVEGAWATACRATYRARSDAFLSMPGFSDADADQAALAIDGLTGLKVHLVVQGDLPAAWASLVKASRVHAIASGLPAADFAAELARIALSEEKARLDGSLLKLKKRRKKVRAQLAA